MFGNNDLNKAKGIIAWYLKRRWTRLAVMSAAQCRMDAMAYVGGTPQQAAAARHRARRDDSEAFCYDDERLGREYQATRCF